MKNVFYTQHGNFKVWIRETVHDGRVYQVREGNRVVGRYASLFNADEAARKMNRDVWNDIAAEDRAYRKAQAVENGNEDL